jgi:hypothetical protein
MREFDGDRQPIESRTTIALEDDAWDGGKIFV